MNITSNTKLTSSDSSIKAQETFGYAVDEPSRLASRNRSFASERERQPSSPVNYFARQSPVRFLAYAWGSQSSINMLSEVVNVVKTKQRKKSGYASNT
jgi:hypothetical protein